MACNLGMCYFVWIWMIFVSLLTIEKLLETVWLFASQ